MTRNVKVKKRNTQCEKKPNEVENEIKGGLKNVKH